MINKLRLIYFNYFLRAGLLISVIGIMVIIIALITGHNLVNKIVVTRGQIIDLSEPVKSKQYYRLTNDYNSTKKERELLKQVRPTKQEIAIFVQTLDDLAVRTGVSQTVEVVMEKGAEGDLIYSVPIIRYQLNVAGGLSAVQNYISELNKVPYLLRFVSVQLTATPEKTMTDSTIGKIIIDIASKE